MSAGEDIIWLTWERHRRTREIAHALAIPLVELLPRHQGVPRYAGLLWRTAVELWRRRPRRVLVQCPSVVLAAWSVVLRTILRYQLILDLHNEAVEPFINKSAAYRRLLEWLHRRADLNIVTNAPLAVIVRDHGGRALVLPDRVPDLPRAAPFASSTPFRVAFVCSFAPDEPFVAVVQAARLLEDIAVIDVTGRYQGVTLPDPLPDNVRLTGFLPDADYVRLLSAADVVVDLTAMENCLVCGAYEAVALQRPLVTSDSAALKRYFSRGAVFCQHDPASIANAIRLAIERRDELQTSIGELRSHLDDEWRVSAQGMLRQLGLPGVVSAAS